MKCKNFILPGILALTINFTYLNAQDTIIEYNNYKWKIGYKFTFDQASNYSLTPNEYYVNNYGIEIRRKLNKFEIESGIYKITHLQDHAYYVPPSLNPSHGYFWNSPVYYHFLNVPMNFIYNTRIFYFSGGTYFEYLISKREKIKLDEVVLQNSDQRKYNFGYSLTIGLEKNISKTNNFFIEGRFLQNLLDNNRVISGITLNGYSNLGIAVGINHKFLN